MKRHLGLYLHIPFCTHRCEYCSFYLEVYHEGRVARFLEALSAEIRFYAERNVSRDDPFHSIYFGGGTPTVLRGRRLVRLLAEIRQMLPVAAECEVCVEAHPATTSEADLAMLAESGVNRISFGAESMNEEELLRIGRRAAVSDTARAVFQARKAGFTNINLDLMYGLPGQSIEDWRQTIAHSLDLSPAHLSCYALTIEPGTKLAHDIVQNRIPGPDEGLQLAMDETAHEMLDRAGYHRYEISNYAKTGFECRHNLLYWTGGEYLGLGPSAQSFVDGVRFGNVADLSAYERALTESRLPVEGFAKLSRGEQQRDAVVFGLRLARGVPADIFRRHVEQYGQADAAAELYATGLIVEHQSRVKLTAGGRRYADTIAEKLY